jgi:hypothetical protein
MGYVVTVGALSSTAERREALPTPLAAAALDDTSISTPLPYQGLASCLATHLAGKHAPNTERSTCASPDPGSTGPALEPEASRDTAGENFMLCTRC